MGQYFGEQVTGPDYTIATFFTGKPVQQSSVFDFSDTPAIITENAPGVAPGKPSPEGAVQEAPKKSPILALALAAGSIYLLSRG